MLHLLQNDSTTRFLFAYVTPDLGCFVVALTILAHLSSDLGREAEIRAFRKLICAYIGFLYLDMAWVLHNFGCLPGPNWLNSLFSVLNMSCVSIMAYYWFLFGELRLHQRWLERPGFRRIARLPLFATILLLVVSPFTGWIFSVSPEGHFVQGPYYVWQFLLDNCYLLWVALHAMTHALRSSSNLEKRECLALVSFIILPTVAGMVDSLVPTMPVIAPAILTSILFVFIKLQEARINSDSLTGMNNRRRTERFLEEKLAAMHGKTGLYFFLGDVNQFKSINDHHGHSEGDKALQQVAECLKIVSTLHDIFCARWGGDEFVIIAEAKKIGTTEELIQSINGRLANMGAETGRPYELAMSFGYAYAGAMRVRPATLVAQADTMLYEVKAKLRNKRRSSMKERT